MSAGSYVSSTHKQDRLWLLTAAHSLSGRGAVKRDGRVTKNVPLLIETLFNIGLYHSINFALARAKSHTCEAATQ